MCGTNKEDISKTNMIVHASSCPGPIGFVWTWFGWWVQRSISGEGVFRGVESENYTEVKQKPWFAWPGIDGACSHPSIHTLWIGNLNLGISDLLFIRRFFFLLSQGSFIRQHVQWYWFHFPLLKFSFSWDGCRRKGVMSFLQELGRNSWKHAPWLVGVYHMTHHLIQH